MTQDIDEISRISVLNQLFDAVRLANYLTLCPEALSLHLLWAELEYNDPEYGDKYIGVMKELEKDEWVITYARVLINSTWN